MKKYKLIEHYPSLPTTWEVGMKVGLGYRSIYYSPCDGKYVNLYLPNTEVENYPEFWEVVEETSIPKKLTPSEVVDTLNNLIWGQNAEHEENFDFYFSYRYSTGHEQIYFEDKLLWCSENEEREFIEELNDYEDLLQFCIRQFCLIGNKMLKLYSSIDFLCLKNPEIEKAVPNSK